MLIPLAAVEQVLRLFCVPIHITLLQTYYSMSKIPEIVVLKIPVFVKVRNIHFLEFPNCNH